jgi:hypothetical protein
LQGYPQKQDFFRRKTIKTVKSASYPQENQKNYPQFFCVSGGQPPTCPQKQSKRGENPIFSGFILIQIREFLTIRQNSTG